MTTNHPDPTPPASPAAVSAPLRPVEEIERDLALASDSSLRGLSNWPWLSIRLIDDIPSLLARLRAAEETLAAVGALHRPAIEEEHHLFRDGSGCIWCDYGGEESRPLLRVDEFEGRVVHIHGVAPVDQVCTEDEREWPCPTAAALAEGASR